MAAAAPVASGFGRTLRYRVEAAAVHGLSAFLRLMPVPAVRATGAALGRLMFAIDGFHRRIAMANIAMAMPSKPADEQRAVVRRVFAHFGSVLLELIKVGTLKDAEILERIESEGEERVIQAHARGRGVLLFTGHFGYWEVGAIALALRVQPMAVMARPLDNPYLHHMLERIRTRSGNSVIYRQGAIRKVLQELAANRAVAILIDQHLHTPDAVHVDFFSRPAATTNALAALALRTGAPVIPAFALPLPNGRYRLVYEHAVEPPASDSPDAVRVFTQRCTDVRRAHTDGRLIVAARPSIAPLYSMVPGVDATIVTEWRGSLTDRQTLDDDARRVKAERADIAILFPNSFASAWGVRRAGVKERWGYAADLRRWLLTRAIARPGGSRHQGTYYQHLVGQLGIPNGPLEPILRVPAAVVDEARSLLILRGWGESQPLLAAAPGAAYGTAKRWIPGYFGSVLTRAIREIGVQGVIIGTSADAESTRLVLDSMDAALRPHVIDLTGATTLPVLAGVLSLAAGCVSNDSGAMHLAGAVGTPLAAIFGPTREKETAPLTRQGRRAEVLLNEVWCRPCMLRECPIDHRCMKGLRPERVFDAVRALMEVHPS